MAIVHEWLISTGTHFQGQILNSWLTNRVTENILWLVLEWVTPCEIYFRSKIPF